MSEKLWGAAEIGAAIRIRIITKTIEGQAQENWVSAIKISDDGGGDFGGDNSDFA